MQLTFDPSNPVEVAAVLALIGGAAPAHPPATAPAAHRPPPAAPAAPAAPQGITRAELTAAIQKYATENRPQAMKAILAEFGFQRAGDVTEDKFAAVMARLV